MLQNVFLHQQGWSKMSWSIFLAFLTFAIKVIGYLNEKVMLQLIEGMGAKLSEGM